MPSPLGPGMICKKLHEVTIYMVMHAKIVSWVFHKFVETGSKLTHIASSAK